MKTTPEIIEQIDQSNAQIDKLFWVGASTEYSDLEEFLQDLDKSAWKEMLPELTETEYYEEYFDDGELIQLLIDNGKLGFIAELTIPTCYDFVFDQNGEMKSCSMHPGRRHIRYAYADTHEELLEKLIQIGQEEFDLDKERDKMKVA